MAGEKLSMAFSIPSVVPVTADEILSEDLINVVGIQIVVLGRDSFVFLY